MNQPRNTMELITEFMDILQDEAQRDQHTAVIRTMTAAAMFFQACARASDMTELERNEAWLMAEKMATDLETQRTHGRH